MLQSFHPISVIYGLLFLDLLMDSPVLLHLSVLFFVTLCLLPSCRASHHYDPLILNFVPNFILLVQQELDPNASPLLNSVANFV
jgi:hypothetical protein